MHYIEPQAELAPIWRTFFMCFMYAGMGLFFYYAIGHAPTLASVISFFMIQ